MDVNFYMESMAWNLGSGEQWFSLLQNRLFLLLKRISLLAVSVATGGS